MVRSDREARADPRRAHRVIREDPAAPDPDPDRPATQREVRAGQHPVDQVDLADRAVRDPADRTVLVDPADRVAPDPADRTDPAVLAERAAHGMGTPSAATSTEPRGETDLHPGVQVSRRRRHGTGRFHRPVERGTMAQSTIGATRKIRCGIPSSTSGASGSLESGFRCNESPHNARFARSARRALCCQPLPGRACRTGSFRCPACDNVT